jgi:hypothetical protein
MPNFTKMSIEEKAARILDVTINHDGSLIWSWPLSNVLNEEERQKLWDGTIEGLLNNYEGEKI